jgi:hypothetical protein
MGDSMKEGKRKIEKELEKFTKEQLISTIKNAIDKNDPFKQEIIECLLKIAIRQLY